MFTGREELLESLIEAFIMEKGTTLFYKEASKRTSNAESEKMFRHLAEWEEQHMYYIQLLYQSVQGDTDIASFEKFSEKVPAPLVEGGMPIKDIDKKLERYEFVNDSDVLRIAFEIEGKSYNLYRRLSETAEDGNARVVMKDMMEQEQKHLTYLKDLEKKLA